MKLVMEMDRERKKRKITDDEEEDEEVKMERFFALIRSAKDIRDQLLDTGKSRQTENQKPPAPAAATAKPEEDQSKGKAETAVWQPCFEPKEFAGNNQVSKTDLNLITKQVTIAGNSSRRSEEENHKADNNNNNNNNNNSSNKNHFQGGRRNRIVFDLNLFPVSVADLDTTDLSM